MLDTNAKMVMEELERVCREESIKVGLEDLLARDQSYIEKTKLCVEAFNILKKHLDKEGLELLLDYEERQAEKEVIIIDFLSNFMQI